MSRRVGEYVISSGEPPPAPRRTRTRLAPLDRPFPTVLQRCCCCCYLRCWYNCSHRCAQIGHRSSSRSRFRRPLSHDSDRIASSDHVGSRVSPSLQPHNAPLTSQTNPLNRTQHSLQSAQESRRRRRRFLLLRLLHLPTRRNPRPLRLCRQRVQTREEVEGIR